MNTQHTPEPWQLNFPGESWTVIGANGEEAFDDGSAGGEYAPGCTPETRDRIVSCVNACQGLDDPAAALKAAREVERCLRQIMQALPLRRDWLDPELEASVFEALSLLTPKGNANLTDHE